MPTYVGNIQVHYSDQSGDRPANYIREFVEGSGDINQDFGGRYVWLTTVGVDNKNPVASGFELVLQQSSNPTMDDLAAGTGGEYRYLVAKHGNWKIRDLVLYRSANKTGVIPEGYDGRTEDLNIGRHRSFLYLLWKHDAI